MIKIRKVKLSDVSQLEELFLKVRQQTFEWKDPKNFKIEDYKVSTKGEKVFVAEVDKKIVGFISIWHDKTGSFVHNLFIYPDFQGMGLGKLLLKETVEVSTPPIT